jgi:hypothetical protein
VLAESLARGEARHPGAQKNQAAIESVRETYRRSGGQTPRLSLADLTAVYEQQLADLSSMSEFRHARITFDPDTFVPAAQRERYASLPSSVPVRDREVEIHYDVEESPNGTIGVARLRLPEKLARSLTEEELPALDRPLRFIVTRGVRGAARAETLAALQDELDRPFTQKEIDELDRAQEHKRRERHHRGRGDRGRGDRDRATGSRARGDDRRQSASGDERLRDHRRATDERFDGRRERPSGPGRFKGRGGKRRGR